MSSKLVSAFIPGLKLQGSGRASFNLFYNSLFVSVFWLDPRRFFGPEYLRQLSSAKTGMRTLFFVPGDRYIFLNVFFHWIVFSYRKDRGFGVREEPAAQKTGLYLPLRTTAQYNAQLNRI
jgi:hypothetical protein